MNKLLLVGVIILFSGCYVYLKYPNTKRVTKRDVRKAMKNAPHK